MTTRSLLIFVIVFVAGASFWLFRVDKGLKNAREIITEQRAAPSPRRSAASAPTTQEIAKETLRSQLRTELQSLNSQLQSERQRLSNQQAQLDQLSAPAAPEQVAPNYSSEITQNRTQITNILNELRGFERMETYINQRAAEVLRDQSSSASVARQELDNNIRTQADLIKQNQDQLTVLEDYRNYVDQREIKMEALRQSIAEQQAQLEAMRQQRLEIASSVLEDSRAVQGQKDQALSDLNQERSELNEEIGSLRAEITRLQAEQADTRMSVISKSTQINRVERNIDEQSRRVQGLEQSLREKESQLNALE
ncbi:Chromosome partition protein Smc [compost metagenome]